MSESTVTVVKPGIEIYARIRPGLSKAKTVHFGKITNVSVEIDGTVWYDIADYECRVRGDRVFTTAEEAFAAKMKT